MLFIDWAQRLAGLPKVFDHPIVDCEQSLFSSKIRGKERKTSKRASVTVSVTWERRCREPLVAWALGDECIFTVTLARLPVLRSFPRIFEEKRDCSQSNPIVSSMVSASQRILGKPKAKKEPITSEMLKALVTRFQISLLLCQI